MQQGFQANFFMLRHPQIARHPFRDIGRYGFRCTTNPGSAIETAIPHGATVAMGIGQSKRKRSRIRKLLKRIEKYTGRACQDRWEGRRRTYPVEWILDYSQAKKSSILAIVFLQDFCSYAFQSNNAFSRLLDVAWLNSPASFIAKISSW